MGYENIMWKDILKINLGLNGVWNCVYFVILVF